MNPLDDVVADVHGIRIVGQQLDPERIPVSGGLKCLVPPTGALHERRA
jgi:hypothetical protein